MWVAGLAGAALAAVIGAMRWLKWRNRIDYPPAESLIIQPQVDVDITRQPDGALAIRWFIPGALSAIYAGTQPDAIDTHTPLNASIDGQSASVTGLPGEMRHYFRLDFADGTCLTAAERVLPLTGAANFRDIGGYTTHDGKRLRWGRVYRSGQLSNLTEDDHRYLAQIGIKLVCDLRAEEEVAEEPDNLPGGVAYHHLPLATEDDVSRGRRLRAILFNRHRLPDVMREVYTRIIIDGNGPLVGNIMRRLAHPENLPAIIHCTAGKDRAGVTAALVMLALGVPEETVIADYTLSNRYYENFRDIADRALKPLARFGVKGDDLYPLITANPAVLRHALDYMRAKYGSVEAYLRDAAGVDDALIASLRANLLE